MPVWVCVVLGVLVLVEVLVDFPPHPATPTAAATVASSVSMASRGERFIGPPYQRDVR